MGRDMVSCAIGYASNRVMLKLVISLYTFVS